MWDVNNVVIEGRLTRDVELKQINDSTMKAEFSIAVNLPAAKDKERVGFFNCVAWKGLAPLIAENFRKGSKISIMESNLDYYKGENNTYISLNVKRVVLPPRQEIKQDDGF
jgi:single-strand DNA-binding protein